MKSYFGKSFDLLRALPRVNIGNLRPNPGSNSPNKRQRGKKLQGTGYVYRQNPAPAGFEGGQTPFYLAFPNQNWKNEKYSRLSYKELRIHTLQQLIDLERIRTDIPIDITQLINTGRYKIDPKEREAGFLLEDDGADCFVAKVNLEVQYAANESVIAAVEKAGGVITTAYYDALSLSAATNPFGFFKSGQAIPRRMLPPPSLVDYYSDPRNRGYLADPDEIAKERLILAQKYGYELPDIENDPNKEMLLMKKDPRQIFYGLEPGWVINLKDKTILKPKAPELKEYYAS